MLLAFFTSGAETLKWNTRINPDEKQAPARPCVVVKL